MNIALDDIEIFFADKKAKRKDVKISINIQALSDGTEQNFIFHIRNETCFR